MDAWGIGFIVLWIFTSGLGVSMSILFEVWMTRTQDDHKFDMEAFWVMAICLIPFLGPTLIAWASCSIIWKNYEMKHKISEYLTEVCRTGIKPQNKGESQ